MILEAIEAVKAAHREQRRALESAYPIGSKWEVMLSAAQKNPSIMEVREHHTGCTPTIRFKRERGPGDRGQWQPPLWKYVTLDRILRRVEP